MNQRIKKLVARFIRSAPAALALAALWIATAPLNAEAAFSAGNTIIRNTINVNYKDAKGIAQAQVSATIDITVNTVAATPTIVSFTPASGTITTDGLGAQQAYTVRIRTNSNGPGAITFSTADGTFTNIAAGTAPTTPGSIFLGSTVIDPSDPMTAVSALANGSPVTYRVPNDGGVPTEAAISGGTTGDGKINGLMALDIVYLYSGTLYYGPFTVTTVTDPAVGSGNPVPYGTIVLTNASGGPLTYTPAYGWQIVEAKDVTVTVTQGAVTVPENVASWVTTLTATMAGAAAATTPTVTTNASMGKIDIKKYVRNVTTPMVGGGLTATSPLTGANSFYTTGVNGKPGEILEYLAVLTDTGKGSSTAVYATDVTPTYVTLVAGSAYGISGGGTIFAKASFLAATAVLSTDNLGGTANIAYGKSTGTTAGSTMTFNLGTGCTNVYLTGGGTLTNNQAAYVIYQVKID